MLISSNEVIAELTKHGIHVRGVLHLGAHECEEKGFYNNDLKISDENIVWIDANPELVEKAKANGHNNVYVGAISNDEKELDFKISNNGQSSSLLDFGLHARYHSWVHYVKTIKVKTETLGQFYNRNGLEPEKYNFWNLDIQGVEYDVLSAAKELLKYADAIYTEVNIAEVYKGCGLMDQIDELLFQNGFKRVITNLTPYKWGDALYIRTP